MASKTNRQQVLRVQIARSMNCHACGYTSLHGYARFHDRDLAMMFADRVGSGEYGEVIVHIYSQSNQTAVDWTCLTRLGSGSVADRVG